jgi:ABC-type antimicrobial peptide transport system permease subunit
MVRDQLREMDANVALFDVGAMDARVARTVRVRRFVAWLVGSFAIVGVLLAALGLYGTLAHAAALRRREIAIRLAVGAWPGSVRAMVARHGVSIAFAGLVPGILMAMAAARVTRSFLFGVGFFDAWTMAGAPIGLVALAVLASWIPAARAASADPLAALREE